MSTPDVDDFFTASIDIKNGEDEPGIMPRFYIQPLQRGEGGEWHDAEMIEINMRGNRLSKWVGIVNDEHRERFKNAYARFKRGLEQTANGTPLEEWPIVTRSLAAAWKSVDVLSVEDVATLPEQNLHSLGMDARGWQKKAQVWLKSREEATTLAKVAAENERKDRRITQLEAQIMELSRKFEALNPDAVPAVEAPLRRRTLSVADQ